MSPSGERTTRSQGWLIAAIAGITIAIFVLDSFFPLGFVIPALYVIPIILTTRVRRSLAPFVVAACATGLTLAGIWTNWTSPVVSLQLGLFNRSLVILAGWSAATIIWHTTQKHARQELEALVAARTAALRQSETTLQSFFNSTDLMMGVLEIVEDQPLMVITNRAAAGAALQGNADALPPALRLAPGAPEFWMPHLEAAHRTGKTVHVKYQIPTTPDAALSERIMTSALSFIGDSPRGNGLYAWIGEDITEKMHLDQTMEASRRSLEVSQAQLRQLTAQLLTAQDDERRRIARELHDELNQRVISLAFDIDDQMQQVRDLSPAARATLQLIKSEVAELSDHLRDLAHRLHPSVLDDLADEPAPPAPRRAAALGLMGAIGQPNYAAAKAGVHHLSRALSLEWARQGVLVNVVAPCITETESRKVILERPGYKEWATTQMLPAGRWNQPEDLVGAVLFLSSHLSDMVVGHVLMVDGGWTIH